VVLGLELLERLLEPASVRLLGERERREPRGDLLKALLLGRACHRGIHVGVLVRLASDGALEVLLGGADRLARGRVADLRQELEVLERVARLAVGRRAEDGSNVGLALDVGLLRKVCVAAVGLCEQASE